MNAKPYLITLWLFLTFGDSYSQEIRQKLRGSVHDAISMRPLQGVNVTVDGSNPLIGTTSDENGKFSLSLAPGRYILNFSSTGYEPARYAEIQLRAGKQEVIDVMLSPATILISEVVISGANDLKLESIRQISMEETMRYAATYYDPARLALSVPAAAATNDQNNNISIRGNSPNHLRWRMEGVEIVNPNHLSNAGMLNDRPVQNGGGVNILSTQLMGNSSFVYGNYDATYGNALGGIFDIFLREGNNEKFEFTTQAGLIGLDVAAEGPLKNEGASFLANYRYSTVGLITAMGVDFGGESIDFQDVAFNLTLPLTNGKLKVFGMGGISNNIFEGKDDAQEWEQDKDRSDITARGKMGAMGVSYRGSIGPKTGLESSVVFSGKEDTRNQRQRGLLGIQEGNADDQYQENLLAAHAGLTFALGNHALKSGVYINNYVYNISRSVGNMRFTSLQNLEINGKQQTLIMPYVSADWVFGKFNINTGLHMSYLNTHGGITMDPRFSFHYQLNPNNELSFSGGSYSQLMSPFIYFSQSSSSAGGRTFPNASLGFLRSRNASLTWLRQITENISLRSEIYYQHFLKVPTSPDGEFTALAYFNGDAAYPLFPEGTGDTYGVEAVIEKKFNNSWYLLTGGNLFESTYTTLAGNRYNTPFNTRFSFNITGGKEFTFDNLKVFSINVRSLWQGGMKDNRLGIADSPFGTFPVFVGEPYGFRLHEYFRLDLRLGWKQEKKGYSRALYLDIQNITNRANTAFYRFDEVLQDIVRETQLGILPLLTYRVDF